MSKTAQELLTELEHYGVKGMKWGVRKDRSSGNQGSGVKDRYRELRDAPLKSLTLKAKNGATVTLNESRKPFVTAAVGAALGKNITESLKSHSSFTISVGGKKVGGAAFEKKGKDEIYLVWLGVNKKERGKGYGSAVFEAAVAYGKQEGAKRLTLEVPGNAPDARHIYEKNGFRVTKEDVNPNDPVWGGLSEMQYDLDKPTLKHSVEDDELERAFEQTFPELQEDGPLEHLLEETGGNSLEHYGVKGMKWGVRKDRSSGRSEKKAAKAEAKVVAKDDRWEIKRQGVGFGTGWSSRRTHAVAKKAVKTMKPELKAINKRPEFRSPKARMDIRKDRGYLKGRNPTSIAYKKAVSDLYMKHVKAAAATELQISPSGRWKESLFTGSNYWGVEVEPVDKIKHEASADPKLDFKVRPIEDEDGYIVDLELVEDGAAQSDVAHLLDETGGDSLEHYGVLGMKWGVRKDRSSKSSGTKKKSSRSEAKAEKKKVAAAKKAANDPKNMSNDELRKQNERMRLEQEFKRLKKEGRPSGGPVADFLVNVGDRQINRVVNKTIDYGVDQLLESAGFDMKKKKK